MAHTPIVLFPHTHVDSRVLERLVETFGSLTLCQPWFTEPVALSDPSKKGLLKVCFPPEVLKPQRDFKQLLSEYQGWMTDHQGRNRPTAFPTGETGDETWAIRTAIRDAGKDADDPALRNTLKWHLVLHLAQNLEENRDAAQSLLQQAAKNKSPLAEAMEKDEEIPDMFEDLPLSATYPYVTDRHLGLIFEAWFGLFGSLIESDSDLLTLDRQVFIYALDLFDGCDVQSLGEIKPSGEKEVDAPGFTVNRKIFPRLLNPSASTDSVLRALSGKTLILVER